MTSDGAGEFEDWVSPHLRAMRLLAIRLVGPADGDDVVQDALARAWRKRRLFDPSRGTARAWLLAIVADRARRSWSRARRNGLALHPGVVPEPDPRLVDLERAIAALPPRMRLAIDCVYFVDLSVAETAVVMGVAEGTVKSTLSDARARLRTQLEVS